jgi:predicted acyltransferase (DUF342 family)
MRTSLIRTVSGAAVAAAAVLALAGPANAAPVSPRVHTTLSIVESRNHITAGQKDAISGRLASRGVGLSKHVVYLDRIAGKSLVAVQAEVTGAHGGVSFTVSPAVTARYELVYLGNAVFAPTHSGLVTVRVTTPVSRARTTLSIVESRNHITAGQKDAIRGRLASRGVGLGKRVVYLDRIAGKSLVAVQAEVTGPDGGVSFTVSPAVTARYELVYRGNAAFDPTHSGVVTVRVTK